MNLGLFRLKSIWWPTWRAWFLIVLLGSVAFVGGIRSAYPFLAPTHRVPAEVLVVEGWLPEYALKAAIHEFSENSYTLLVTSGGPLWEGHHASGFHSYAELAGQVLRGLNFDTNQLAVAPGPKVWRHRTFHSAKAVQDYLVASKLDPSGINIMTLGPHGKRTEIIYSEVFGDQIPLGIISFPSSEYDQKSWWRTSEGTKHVLTEAMASSYEGLFNSGRNSSRIAE
ncbi:hypothetical protein N8766_02995 [bacterium]|jgi:hypothetical protein|nr:hypothetical protein [Verrucomicrobiota bacterium]MDA7510979.1 hypothetical protein [Verrucomicrobiota bacterium]MDA7633054.1 hypothetical protein [bacterium]